MRFCTNCGEELTDVRFCPQCGTPRAEVVTAARSAADAGGPERRLPAAGVIATSPRDGDQPRASPHRPSGEARSSTRTVIPVGARLCLWAATALVALPMSIGFILAIVDGYLGFGTSELLWILIWLCATTACAVSAAKRKPRGWSWLDSVTLILGLPALALNALFFGFFGLFGLIGLVGSVGGGALLVTGLLLSRRGGSDPAQGVSPAGLGAWGLAVFFFGWVGGVTGYLVERDANPARAANILRWGLIWTAIWFGISVVITGILVAAVSGL